MPVADELLAVRQFETIMDEGVASAYVTLRRLCDGVIGEMKWYEHDEDMLRISARWPGWLFTLQGLGEDGAQWRAYFLNGKTQLSEAHVTFDAFDESKLR
jgi:hypothetical protein